MPATPGSELKKGYEKSIKESGVGIKVVKKSGRMIKSRLQSSDPFQKRKCEDYGNSRICGKKIKGGTVSQESCTK